MSLNWADVSCYPGFTYKTNMSTPIVMNVIPLGDVFGEKTVRVTPVLEIGEQCFSIRDSIMAVCQKSANDAGEVWRKLSDSNKTEVQDSVLNFKFPGRGQSVQPVITLKGLLKLIMMLPGETAKRYRSQFSDIITRYLAGDSSLHAEINANASSSSPVNALAREAGCSGSKRHIDDINSVEESINQISNQVGGLERRLVNIKCLTQEIDFEKMVRLYELEDSTLDKKLRLEGTVNERLMLEAERAKHASEAAARLEASRDAELVRLERKLEIEAKFKTITSVAPVSLNKSILQLASEQPYWTGLDAKTQRELVTKAGTASGKKGIPAVLDKQGETGPTGTWARVNVFEPAHHQALRVVLEDTLANLRGAVMATPCIQVFFQRAAGL